MQIKTIINDAGFELFDEKLVRENGRLIYRLLLSKQGGVSLQDCTKMHQILSPILDVYPPTKDEYFLEISSPGVERKLNTLEQCKQSIGELIRTKDYEKNIHEGKLISVNDDKLELLLADASKTWLAFDEQKSIRTYVNWDA